VSAPKSAVTKAIAEERQRAQEIDNRRQKQIANQVEIIDRLMDGASYDDVMRHLQDRLVDAQMELADAQAENAVLQAELKKA
jgi:hypothetical protein